MLFAASVFLIVFVAAAGADDDQIKCDRYSSTAGGEKTVMQFQEDPNRADFTLTKGGDEQYWQFSGSAGTGLAGMVYSLRDKPDAEGSILYGSSIILDHNAQPAKETELLLFLDMVFWPNCR
jgi:hypothetical protein